MKVFPNSIEAYIDRIGYGSLLSLGLLAEENCSKQYRDFLVEGKAACSFADAFIGLF